DMFLLLLFIPALAQACHHQFQKELRYLELYLGIQPENEGQLPVKHASRFQQYITASQELDCKFDGECLWSNLENDGVLDSSDFWYFHKSDKKRFPTQLQPGKRKLPKGTHFIVTGNTTVQPQSAIILSAPIPCQKGEGRLAFNYWLYNFAQLQVLVVKAAKRRGHLQIIGKPETDCHYYRPKDDVCHVTIPHIDEPFRIAIRAFSLKDHVVGSMALLNDISYNAVICEKSPLSNLFEAIPIGERAAQPSRMYTLSDMNCVEASNTCRWRNGKDRTNTKWKIGRGIERWNEEMIVSYRSSRPIGHFFFLAVDSLTAKPFARFESDMIPCTQKATTLSFQYWAKTGTQVEVCSIDERGVPLSCAYLTDEDGGDKPIEIVVDPYGKPFRFSFEIITFDQFSGGLVAINNIQLKGVLCSEKLPPVSTTISPNTIADSFALTPRPIFEGSYPLQLGCDWTSDPCFQWVDEDGKLFVGKAPEDSEEFPFPEELINGNVGAIFLNGADTAILRSREVPCAWDLEITLTYWRSEHGFIRVCALDQCVDGGKTEGKISLLVSSMRPFEVTIEARSRGNAIVAIDSILTEGEACPIKTLEQTLCDNVKCDFKGTFCGYSTNPVSTGDLPLQLVTKGATVTIDEKHNRAVLASSSFEIVQPALLLLKVTQETFGSRLLLCPDAKSEPDACTELLGPIVLSPQTRELSFPLDPSTRRFAIVFLHDKGAQFGEATFTLHSVDVKTGDNYQLCF
ncbi:mam-3, partial [Pristionchus pacificus]